MQDERLTPREAAHELGLSTRAVQHRLKHGLLAGENYRGRLWLIPRAAVEAAKRQGHLKRGPKPRQDH